LYDGVDIVTAWEFQPLAIIRHDVIGFSIAAVAPTTGLGFNHKNAPGPDGNVINIAALLRLQIVKDSITGISRFVQCLGHGLLAEKSQANIPCVPQFPTRSQH
jgi:hypothetical protein